MNSTLMPCARAIAMISPPRSVSMFSFTTRWRSCDHVLEQVIFLDLILFVPLVLPMLEGRYDPLLRRHRGRITGRWWIGRDMTTTAVPKFLDIQVRASPMPDHNSRMGRGRAHCDAQQPVSRLSYAPPLRTGGVGIPSRSRPQRTVIHGIAPLLQHGFRSSSRNSASIPTRSMIAMTCLFNGS